MFQPLIVFGESAVPAIMLQSPPRIKPILE